MEKWVSRDMSLRNSGSKTSRAKADKIENTAGAYTGLSEAMFSLVSPKEKLEWKDPTAEGWTLQDPDV